MFGPGYLAGMFEGGDYMPIYALPKYC